MAYVQVVKSYLHFKVGQELEVAPKAGRATASSVEIMDGPNVYSIPWGFVKLVNPTGKSASQSAVRASTLNDLLGFDPVFGHSVDPSPPAPTKKMSLGDKQTFLTHWTGGRLPTSGVDLVIQSFGDEEWTQEHRTFIPSVDYEFVWNPDVLEALVLSKMTGSRCLLEGPPGTGKTTAHKQFAAILGQPFYRINGKDGLEPASLVGNLAPDGEGGWKWYDGTLVMAMQKGYYLCVDEVFKLPPGIQMTMQSVYEKGGVLVLDEKPGTLDDKVVHPHEYFHLCATDNVKGLGDNFDKSAATQMQDTSTLDRFGITMHVPYLSEVVETQMLMDRYDSLQSDTIRSMVMVANLIRRGYNNDEISLTLSPRGLFSMCDIMLKGIPAKYAFKMAYLNKLADEVEKEAVAEFCRNAKLA